MMPYLAAGLKKYGIFLGFLAVVIVLSLLSPAFRTFQNLANIVRQTSIHGIMAVGMTFVVLTAGIDLSVGSTLALAGVLCASFAHWGWPLPAVLAATLLTGSLLGLLNGLVITKGKVTPFVVTLGMMSIARGAAHLFTGAAHQRLQPGVSLPGGRRDARRAGADRSVPAQRRDGRLALRRTRWGRYLYAIGGNLQAAKLSGIPVDRCTTWAYVLCGLTAAASALVLTARLNAAESIAGAGYELDVIASVVIGGTSLAGGRGGVWGTLLGALTDRNHQQRHELAANLRLFSTGR